jgi:hypothetical protein
MAGSLGGAACEAGGAVDCLLGDWGVWSTCDVTWMEDWDITNKENKGLIWISWDLIGDNHEDLMTFDTHIYINIIISY